MNSGEYLINRGEVLRKAYTLLCLFFANKEISRFSDPQDQQAPLKSLENIFFESEASRLLLEIAIAVRVIDDQMNRLPEKEANSTCYIAVRKKVDSYDFGLFDDSNLSLRDVCNKIIHSREMQPFERDGQEPHEQDMAFKYGMGDKEINWRHFNGYIRLSEPDYKNGWSVLLDLPVFIAAVYELLTARQ